MGELQQYANYSQFKAELDMELKKTANSFVRIGFLLKVAKDTDVLRESRYGNVWDFAKAEYGLDKSQASRFMSINTKFSEGGYSDHLLTQYEGYGSSKLTIMLNLPDSIIEELDPTMSKQEIRGIAGDYKAEQETTPMEHLFEKAPKPKLTNNLQKAIFEIGRENPQMWVDISRACGGSSLEAVLGEIASIMAPDGERNFRVRVPQVGRMMLKICDDGKVTVLDMRTTQKENYNLQDVANAWCYIGTDPTENPYDTWEATYEADFPNRPTPKPVKKEDFKVLQTETEDEDEKTRENEGQEAGEAEPEGQTGETEDEPSDLAECVSVAEENAGPEEEGEGCQTESKEDALDEPDKGKEPVEAGYQNAEEHAEGCTGGTENDNPGAADRETAETEEPDAVTVPEEEQIPGQMEVQDYPELMPENSEETPNNSEETPKNSEIASAMNPPVEETKPAAVTVPEEEQIEVEVLPPEKPSRREKAWGVGLGQKDGSEMNDSLDSYIVSGTLLADNFAKAIKKHNFKMARKCLDQMSEALDKMENIDVEAQ